MKRSMFLILLWTGTVQAMLGLDIAHNVNMAKQMEAQRLKMLTDTAKNTDYLDWRKETVTVYGKYLDDENITTRDYYLGSFISVVTDQTLTVMVRAGNGKHILLLSKGQTLQALSYGLDKKKKNVLCICFHTEHGMIMGYVNKSCIYRSHRWNGKLTKYLEHSTHSGVPVHPKPKVAVGQLPGDKTEYKLAEELEAILPSMSERGNADEIRKALSLYNRLAKLLNVTVPKKFIVSPATQPAHDAALPGPPPTEETVGQNNLPAQDPGDDGQPSNVTSPGALDPDPRPVPVSPAPATLDPKPRPQPTVPRITGSAPASRPGSRPAPRKRPAPVESRPSVDRKPEGWCASVKSFFKGVMVIGFGGLLFYVGQPFGWEFPQFDNSDHNRYETDDAPSNASVTDYLFPFCAVMAIGAAIVGTHKLQEAMTEKDNMPKRKRAPKLNLKPKGIVQKTGISSGWKILLLLIALSVVGIFVWRLLATSEEEEDPEMDEAELFL